MIPEMGFEQGGIQEPLPRGGEFNSALKGIEEIILAIRHIRWANLANEVVSGGRWGLPLSQRATSSRSCP